MKLGDYRCQKVTEPNFCGKFIFAKIWAKSAQKIGYFAFFKKKNWYFFPYKQCKMKVLFIFDFPSQTPYLAKFLFRSYYPKCCWPIRLQDSFKCNISKKQRDQVGFLFANKHQSFLQFGAITFGGRTRSNLNNMFAVYFWYFRSEVSGKFDFLHEDKHQSLPQTGCITFTGQSQAYSTYPK